MDTNNNEYQQALMELYAAVLKVLRLSGTSVFTEKEKHDEMLANVLALINSCGYGSSTNSSFSASDYLQKETKHEPYKQQPSPAGTPAN